ncbi:MAG: SPOR domain-containing protein [Dongiaceae bacterium]
MSEPDIAAPSSPLLARKGAAVPAAALTRGRAAPPERQTNGHRPVAASPPEAAAAETRRPDAQASTEEPAPPGSLLSFGLRRRGEARDVLAAAPSDAIVAPPVPDLLVAEAATAIGVVHPPRAPYRGAAIAAVVLIALVAVGGTWYGYDRVVRDVGPDPRSGTPAASETQAGAEATAPSATAGEVPTTPATEAPPAAAEEPSFDVVRVSPSGDAVIAGRAAPHTELIVLDNGEPIGTVRADAIGDWILIPAAPLDPGEHEFSLVVKTPHGTIVLPPPAGGVDADDAPVPTPQSDAAPPPPPALKPTATSASAAASAFLVQLASVKSETGATQEWSRLQRDFPDLLSDKKLRVDRANLGERGAFFRIRTGPFDDREQAHGLCRELTAREQSCLVIER